MKKTEHITLGLLAGMALAFTSGCGRRAERRDCVDEAGRLANDQNCQTVEQRRRSGYAGVLPYYHYLYGGSSGGHVGRVPHLRAVFSGAKVGGGTVHLCGFPDSPSHVQSLAVK